MADCLALTVAIGGQSAASGSQAACSVVLLQCSDSNWWEVHCLVTGTFRQFITKPGISEQNHGVSRHNYSKLIQSSALQFHSSLAVLEFRRYRGHA